MDDNRIVRDSGIRMEPKKVFSLNEKSIERIDEALRLLREIQENLNSQKPDESEEKITKIEKLLNQVKKGL